jgi:hypothetical protein
MTDDTDRPGQGVDPAGQDVDPAGQDVDPALRRRYEARLRRWAATMGLAIEKSRARDPLRMDYGRYRVVDPRNDCVVAGRFPFGYTLSLGDVADVLEELETSRAEQAAGHRGSPGERTAGGFDAKWER